MDRILTGRSILIVEDEPVIVIDIAGAFERAGACVLRTNTLRQALLLLEEQHLSAAVLDHGLTNGNSSKLCERLKELDIPYVLHSGYSSVDGPL
jgi:DNA-binding response OmpR family regulator